MSKETIATRKARDHKIKLIRRYIEAIRLNTDLLEQAFSINIKDIRKEQTINDNEQHQQHESWAIYTKEV